jgi:hypothetical protein
MTGGTGRLRASAAAPFLLLAALPAFPATPADLPLIDNYREIEEHRLGPDPVVLMPWRDITDERDRQGWTFNLTVDADGKVTTANLKRGSRELRDEAKQAALALQFKPSCATVARWRFDSTSLSTAGSATMPARSTALSPQNPISPRW